MLLLPKCNIILYQLDSLKLISTAVSIGKDVDKVRILIPSGWSVNLNNYQINNLAVNFVKRKRAISHD